MARFASCRVHFGMRQEDDEAEDNGEGLPSPKTIRVKARRVAGDQGGTRNARLDPGTRRSIARIRMHPVDMTDILHVLFEKLG